MDKKRINFSWIYFIWIISKGEKIGKKTVKPIMSEKYN